MGGYHLYEAPLADHHAARIDGVLTEAPRLVEWRAGASIYLKVKDQRGTYEAEIPYFYFIQPESVTEELLALPSGQQVSIESTRDREPRGAFIASSVRSSGKDVLSRSTSERSRRAADLALIQLLGTMLSLGLVSLLVYRVRWARYL